MESKRNCTFPSKNSFSFEKALAFVGFFVVVFLRFGLLVLLVCFVWLVLGLFGFFSLFFWSGRCLFFFSESKTEDYTGRETVPCLILVMQQELMKRPSLW